MKKPSLLARLSGRGTVRYFNRSPDPLRDIAFPDVDRANNVWTP